MNLEELMTDLIIAQRSFQANSNVLNRARESYERALEIGK
jgi:flagellar basal body rod protein FlgC